MGQKVNPNGIRLGITQDWKSKWYCEGKKFAEYLNGDIKIRKYLNEKLKDASVEKICIERPAKNAKVTVYSARPGLIIGRKGGDINVLKAALEKIAKMPVHLTIEETKKPDLVAKLVAENIASQLERRVMFRRAMKRSLQSTMRAGAKGIKIMLGGRLGGAEIARSEGCHEGRVPLHTFKADIDYATAKAHTTYGVIGVKVWIYKGDKQPVKGRPANLNDQESDGGK